MIKAVYGYGNQVLRKEAEEIDENYKGLSEVIANMYETMEYSDGVGLAAPQIGLPIRLFVIDADVMSDDYPEAAGFRRTFINPIMVSESGEEWPFQEGCLSVPGIREDVIRKSTIVLNYLNEDFEEVEEEFSGICARVIQHEYDHLEGILFVDRLNPLKKRLLKGKLTNIEKGTVPVNYKMRFYNRR